MAEVLRTAGSASSGVDINPECKKFEDAQTQIFIGDQGDRDFLTRGGRPRSARWTSIIEDGGHHPNQQLATFEVFYPRMSENGCFIIEDLHTSYWPQYSGGLRRKGTFMQFAKNRVGSAQRLALPPGPATSRRSGSRAPRGRSTSTTASSVFERGTVKRPKKRQMGEPHAH